MLLTNHVLSGALIGAMTGRPAPAFAVAVASHFVLDALPHWGDWASKRQFLQVAVPDGLIGLAAMGALTALSPAERRPAVLAGMTGAALPDLDKPTVMCFGRSPFPGAVDRFHSGIQREAAGRAHLELLAAAAMGVAVLAVLRRPAGHHYAGSPTGGDRDEPARGCAGSAVDGPARRGVPAGRTRGR